MMPHWKNRILASARPVDLKDSEPHLQLVELSTGGLAESRERGHKVYFWVYGHCTRHGYSWLRASTQTPHRMPDLRVTPVWLRLAYAALKSGPNPVMSWHCFWLAGYATQMFHD
ncbi:hypothetical protein V1283_008873 [Bradyrhizobium sp. AZCC 2262]